MDAHVYLPPEWNHVWNIIMYGNGKMDWLWGWTLPKIPIICNKASNKSCGATLLSTKRKSFCGYFINKLYLIIFERKFWILAMLIYFPISIHYNISNTTTFWALQLRLQAEIDMGTHCFLLEIEISTTIIWNFFAYDRYFWVHSAPKSIYFPISVHYNILNMAIFRAYWLHS